MPTSSAPNLAPCRASGGRVSQTSQNPRLSRRERGHRRAYRRVGGTFRVARWWG